MSDGRTESVRIRFTPAEKEALAKRAEAAKVTVSDLLRAAAVGTPDAGIAPESVAETTWEQPTTETPSEPRAKLSNVRETSLTDRINRRADEIRREEGGQELAALNRARREMLG